MNISSCYQEFRNSKLLKQSKSLVLIPPIGLAKSDSCFGNGVGRSRSQTPYVIARTSDDALESVH
jgi:hypothetical protein